MRGRVVNGGGDFFGNDAAATGELTASLDHVVVNEFEEYFIELLQDMETVIRFRILHPSKIPTAHLTRRGLCRHCYYLKSYEYGTYCQSAVSCVFHIMVLKGVEISDITSPGA
ncbi:hypothetical protein Q1695_013440 [Nippostrongylus brasiliensis]|nr:hypothetical protein Q1695_013440 [Nippostrongylus brasiliensis]